MASTFVPCLHFSYLRALGFLDSGYDNSLQHELQGLVKRLDSCFNGGMKNPHNDRQRKIRIARAAEFKALRKQGLTLGEIAARQVPPVTPAAIWNVLNK